MRFANINTKLLLGLIIFLTASAIFAAAVVIKNPTSLTPQAESLGTCHINLDARPACGKVYLAIDFYASDYGSKPSLVVNYQGFRVDHQPAPGISPKPFGPQNGKVNCYKGTSPNCRLLYEPIPWSTTNLNGTLTVSVENLQVATDSPYNDPNSPCFGFESGPYSETVTLNCQEDGPPPPPPPTATPTRLPSPTPTTPVKTPTPTPSPSVCPTPPAVENLKIVCPVCQGT